MLLTFQGQSYLPFDCTGVTTAGSGGGMAGVGPFCCSGIGSGDVDEAPDSRSVPDNHTVPVPHPLDLFAAVGIHLTLQCIWVLVHVSSQHHSLGISGRMDQQ